MVNFENFSKNTLSAREIVDYVKDITPDEDMLPDYFLKQVLKERVKFKKEKVKIQYLMDKDPSFKEYINAKEERYGTDGWSNYEPNPDDLDLPIVVFNDTVIDGYSRASYHFHKGEGVIDAYVSIKK